MSAHLMLSLTTLLLGAPVNQDAPRMHASWVDTSALLAGNGASARPSFGQTPPIKSSRQAMSCPTEPLDMVKAVYARYAAGRPPSLAKITCWSPATQALIDSRRLAFDPVVQGQDYQLSDVQVSARKDGSVQATFVNIDQKLTVIWTFEHSDRWRVVDLLHQGKSLAKTLKAQPKQR